MSSSVAASEAARLGFRVILLEKNPHADPLAPRDNLALRRLLVDDTTGMLTWLMSLGGELFNMMAKTQLIHVPYNGGGPAAVALISGEIRQAHPQRDREVGAGGESGGRARGLMTRTARHGHALQRRALAPPSTVTIVPVV